MKEKIFKRLTSAVMAVLMVFGTVLMHVPAYAGDPYVPRQFEAADGEFIPEKDDLIHSFTPGDEPEELTDVTAVYEVPVRLRKAYEDSNSMGNGAVEQIAQLKRTTHGDYLEFKLVGLKFLNMYGHVWGMNYNKNNLHPKKFNEVEMPDEMGIISYRTDRCLEMHPVTPAEKETLPANYPNRDDAKMVRIMNFPHHFRAHVGNIDLDAEKQAAPYSYFIGIQVAVDAMDSIASGGASTYEEIVKGKGTQYARLQFDLTQAKQILTVEFQSDEGEHIETKTVKEGDIITATELEPGKMGYELVGWGVDNVPFDFSQPITKSLVLKPVWKKLNTGGRENYAAMLAEAERLIGLIHSHQDEPRFQRAAEMTAKVKANFDKLNWTDEDFVKAAKSFDSRYLQTLVEFYALENPVIKDAAEWDWLPSAYATNNTKATNAPAPALLKKYQVPVNILQATREDASLNDIFLEKTGYYYEDDTKSSVDIFLHGCNIFGLNGHIWGMKYNPENPTPSSYDAFQFTKDAAELDNILTNSAVSMPMTDDEKAALPDDYPAKDWARNALQRYFPTGYRFYLNKLDSNASSYRFAVRTCNDVMDSMFVDYVADKSFYDKFKPFNNGDGCDLKLDFANKTLIYDKTALVEKIKEIKALNPQPADAAEKLAAADTVMNDTNVDQAAVDTAIEDLDTLFSVTVTFDSNGGSDVAPVEVRPGELLKQPANPTLKDRTFVEWRLNGKAYDFNQPVKEAMTLKAAWKLDPTSAAAKQLDKNVAEVQRLLDILTFEADDPMLPQFKNLITKIAELKEKTNPSDSQIEMWTISSSQALPMLAKMWQDQFGSEVTVKAGDWLENAYKSKSEKTPNKDLKKPPLLKKYDVPLRLMQLNGTSPSMGNSGIVQRGYFYQDDEGNASFDFFTQAAFIFNIYGHVWELEYDRPDGTGKADIIGTAPDRSIVFKDLTADEKNALPADYPGKDYATKNYVMDFPYGFRFDVPGVKPEDYKNSYEYQLKVKVFVDAMDSFEAQMQPGFDQEMFHSPALYDLIKKGSNGNYALIQMDFSKMTQVYDKTELRDALKAAKEYPANAALQKAIDEAIVIFEDTDTNQQAVDEATAKLKVAVEKYLEKNGWIKENGAWYFYRNNEIVKSSLIQSDGALYFLKNDGVRAENQWIYVDGNWYWAKDNGIIAQSQWVYVDGKWYWAKDNGVIALKQWVYVDGKWYWATGSGAIALKQWVYVDGKWYWATGSGAIAESQWVLANGKWYYALTDGRIAKNQWIHVNNVRYWAAADGSVK